MTISKTQFFNLFFGNYNLSEDKIKYSSTLALLDLMSDNDVEKHFNPEKSDLLGMSDLLDYFKENGKNEDIVGKLKEISKWNKDQKEFHGSDQDFEKVGLTLKDSLILPNNEYILEPLKELYLENKINQ
ncbi:MAG: hypothetical protein SLAVMIC_00683 [uncultured marine phage]|uniref:Uncharacterized protein n=1 Tax=uncultured marine phage TaxID=707152 RepID=A0A8D9C9B7_9VIRU|nr:MAG: hypothetical protein SLAVMIC_00683 [uncultured marine phage]